MFASIASERVRAKPKVYLPELDEPEQESNRKEPKTVQKETKEKLKEATGSSAPNSTVPSLKAYPPGTLRKQDLEQILACNQRGMTVVLVPNFPGHGWPADTTEQSE